MLGRVEMMLIYVCKTKFLLEDGEICFYVMKIWVLCIICEFEVWVTLGHCWMCSRCCMEGLEAI